MKKIGSLFLALALLLALSAPALAAEDYTVVVPVGTYNGDDNSYGEKNFSEGLAPVGVIVHTPEGRFSHWEYGYIDTTGAKVIPFKFDDARRFSDGLAAVKMDGNWTDLGLLSDGKWGFIDKTGTVVIPCKYDNVYSFSEDLAAVQLDGKWGFIDKTGTEVIPCQYTGLAGLFYSAKHGFSEGLAAVQLDGKWGFIDKTGAEVVPCKYNNVYTFSEGLAAVQLDGKWGFIDKTGTEVIPCQYTGLAGLFYSAKHGFSEGLAGVFLDGRCFYIDKTGAEVLSIPYSRASNFFDGLAAVYGEGGWGFIDKTGALVIPCKYNGTVYDFSEGFAQFMMMGGQTLWGFVDKTGKEIIYTYDWGYEYGDVHEGLAQVRRFTAEAWDVGFIALNGAAAPAAPPVNVSVKGAQVVWMDVKPFIDENSRTLVPLRAVADALGLQVSWIASERLASFTDGTRIISFPIGLREAYTSEGTIELDTAAVIVNDRTFAPARYLAEYFGYAVGWDGATRTVTID